MRINVLKPFIFVMPTHGRGSKEVRFTVGQHEIGPEIANHPWISAGADGAIESKEQARERIERLRQAYQAAAATLSAAEQAESADGGERGVT
jgi:hypothetical protein